jgi:hypothetical protein
MQQVEKFKSHMQTGTSNLTPARKSRPSSGIGIGTPALGSPEEQKDEDPVTPLLYKPETDMSPSQIEIYSELLNQQA